MKIVTLRRVIDNDVQTIGVMTVDNLSFDTLERPWKNNAKNISCIPKGTYEVKWTWSPLFMRSTYEVLKVPGRSGIRFHKGNYFFDVQGCILLGIGYKDINKDKQVDVSNSEVTMKKFEDYMKREPFTLIIK